MQSRNFKQLDKILEKYTTEQLELLYSKIYVILRERELGTNSQGMQNQEWGEGGDL